MEGFSQIPQGPTQKTENKARDFIPEGIFEADLSDPQKAGIIHSINLGRELQKGTPDLAADFKSGLTLDQIVEKHNLQTKLGASLSTARNAVWFALKGYGEEIRFAGAEPFDGLVNPEEYELIAQQHRREASAKTGRSNRESGLRQFAEKKGIHAQTPEERQALIRSSALARGLDWFEQEEVDLIKELILLPEYRHGSRIRAGKIAEELNKRFHNGEKKWNQKQITKKYYLLRHPNQSI